MRESKNIIPENWPPDIVTILSKVTPKDCAKIVDFINLSWQAGFFDGEGSFQWVIAIPQVASQDIECLQLFLDRHGGHIGLQSEAGTIVYTVVNGVRIPTAKYNKDMYQWLMTGRIMGPKSRSYIDKTKFLLSILPLQHSQSKIKNTIKAILKLGWSSRARWEHLIPGNIEVSLPVDNRIDVDGFFK